MRKGALLLLLAGMAWPALAAKTISVEQLERLLATLHGKSDGHVAQQLADVELTERVSPARLARWEADFAGSRTHEALRKLADVSAFLNPPASDVYPGPAPDSETQQRMLALALDYVKTTITRLPNFYATRETMHFEDVPSQQVVQPSGVIPAGSAVRAVRVPGITLSESEYKPLHSTGTSSTMVTYRNGYEVRDADAEKGKKEDQPVTGLTTNGEFGPILSVVMGDAMRSEVTWLRWELAASGPMGVFHYTVPEELSNYVVRIPAGTKVEQVYPGYHGEIAIDPATGSILRISIIADLSPPHQMMETAILVEYAPVVIGEQSYICPVRGVAFSKVPAANAVGAPQGSTVTVQTQLNDVAFTHYHLFRSEARIVDDGSGKSDAGSGGAGTVAAPGGNATPASAPSSAGPTDRPR